MTMLEEKTWVQVCALDDLAPDRGAAVLVRGRQVALFRLAATGEVRGISNLDPFSGTNVISRGIVGSKGEVRKVASPMYKQSFDLDTGACLDDPEVTVPVFDVRVVDGRVEVATP
jgi:nitrite reductase (NADH) small subunit